MLILHYRHIKNWQNCTEYKIPKLNELKILTLCNNWIWWIHLQIQPVAIIFIYRRVCILITISNLKTSIIFHVDDIILLCKLFKICAFLDKIQVQIRIKRFKLKREKQKKKIKVPFLIGCYTGFTGLPSYLPSWHRH